MIRLILILLLITALSLGLAWVADEPGRVMIDWGDYHVETSLLVLIAATALLALWCMIAYTLVMALIRTPRSWLRSRLARRQALGLESLTAAFAAIATQDIRAARKQIRRAQHYLPHQPLTLMLASQVARLEGNESQSRLYLEQMLKAESTEFMALRGLIEAARRSHDDKTALLHAEKALALKPQDGWLATTLAGIYTRAGRAQDALRLLEKSARKGAISRAEQRTLTAAVLFEHARPLVAQQRFDMALPALHDAIKCEPGLAPASALLAQAYLSQGDVSRALKAILQGWKALPHPLLTQAMLAAWEPAKTRAKVLKVAQKLARIYPAHRESRFLMAAIAVKQGEADTARHEAQLLVDEQETIRACTAMAQAEQNAGNGTQATEWIRRSHAALSDPGYGCSTCRQPVDSWQLTCPHCGGVGTMEWK